MKSAWKPVSTWLVAAAVLLCGTAFAQEWRKLPGAAKDIGVGADGSVWVVGTDAATGGSGIYRYNGTAWDRAQIGAVRIDVDPNGQPWIVNDKGEIHYWADRKWNRMPGAAKDVGVGSNGAIWVVGTDGGIYRWNGSGWTKMPGQGKRIDVDGAGNAWVVNEAGDVYAWNGSNAFIPQPGVKASDIGVCGDAAFALDAYGRLYRHASGGWGLWSSGAGDPRYQALSVDCDRLPWAVGAGGEIVTQNAAAVDAAAAPVATALNAKFVGSGSSGFVERSPGTWEAVSAVSGGLMLRELQRNQTSIQLKGPSGEYLLDFSKRAIFGNLSGEGTPTPIASASLVTALTVSYIDLTLHDGAGAIVSRTVLMQRSTNGAPTDWLVNAGRGPRTIATDAVARPSLQRVTFNIDGLAYDVDVIARQCKVNGYACKVARVQDVTGYNAGQFTLNVNGQLQRLTHTSENPKQWQLEGVDLTPETWEETQRTLDYVEFKAQRFGMLSQRLRVNGGWDSVQPSGVAVPQGKPVVAAQRHWRGQLGTIFAPVSPGVSPGFQIQNKTDYPVLVTLEQVGCLYYEIVQPGQVFQRNTGAVWFTIKASMAPDLKEPTVLSCVRDPAIYAATIAAVAVSFLATGGTAGSLALAIPQMVFVAGVGGTAIATEDVVLQAGGTGTEARAARYGVVALANAAGFAGLGILRTGAIWAGSELKAFSATQAHIDAMKADLVQEAVVAGAYAGPPWPAPMSNRVMPRYDITGGPRIVHKADGSFDILKQAHPLKITRVN